MNVGMFNGMFGKIASGMCRLGINDKAIAFSVYRNKIIKSFGNLLKQNYIEVNCDNIGEAISNIIISNTHGTNMNENHLNNNTNEIS